MVTELPWLNETEPFTSRPQQITQLKVRGRWGTCSTQLAISYTLQWQHVFKVNWIWVMLVTWVWLVTSLSTLPHKFNWKLHHHRSTHLMVHREAIFPWQPVESSAKHGTLKFSFAHFIRYTRLYIGHLHQQVLELLWQWNVCFDALDHQCPDNTLSFPDSKQWVAHNLRGLHSYDRRHRNRVRTATVASLSI